MTALKWKSAHFLSYLKTNPKFRKILFDEESIEPIIEDLYSYQDSNCGRCKRNVLKFIDDNPDVINKVIEKYEALETASHESEPASKAEPVAEPVVESRLPSNANANANDNIPLRVVGEVFRIPANPDAYKLFVLEAQQNRWIYRGLTVIEKEDSWIVLFY